MTVLSCCPVTFLWIPVFLDRVYICFWSYTGCYVLPQVGRVVFGLVCLFGELFRWGFLWSASLCGVLP